MVDGDDQVKIELMTALWRHLKPAPYPHGPQALRILGKLAGRNRDFLHVPPKLKTEEFIEKSFDSLVEFEDGSKVVIQLDRSVQQAKQKIMRCVSIEIHTVNSLSQ